MKFSIDIDVAKAVQDIEAFRIRKETEVMAIARKSADNILEAARAMVPVDTGKLRQSLRVEWFGNGAFIGTPLGLPYGIYVERGTGIYAANGDGRKTPWFYYYRGNKGPHGLRFTRGQKPQPYLIPAWHQEIPHFTKEIQKELRKLR
jgi:HK97 gp10 family phage protein